MKVLHITGGMNLGGQETFIMNVFRNIDKNKYDFHFLCISPKKKQYYLEEVYELGGKIFNFTMNWYDKNPITKFLMRKSKTKKFLRLNKEHNYDIVHIHTSHSISYLLAKASLEFGIKKVIVHSHNSNLEHGILIHRIFKKRMSKLKIIRLACSVEASKFLFGESKSHIILNGIELSKFAFDNQKRNEIRNEMGLMDSFVIGHIGRFENQKNHRFLIELAKEYFKVNSKARLVLIGEGNLKHECRTLVNEYKLQDKVFFLGNCGNVNELLNIMDIFIFPSLYEGLGIVSIEAQANALPVIHSNFIPKLTMISNKVIWVDLKEPIKKWIEEIENVCKSNRALFEKSILYDNFNIHKQIEKLVDIYND